MQTVCHANVCARCTARPHKGCCRITPDMEEVCFPISGPERDRITAYTGTAGLFTSQANTPAFMDMLHTLFPRDPAALRELFPADGVHYRLGTRADGSCAYLTQSGCGLPHGVRPHHCSLYPVWFVGRRLVAAHADCLMLAENASRFRLLNALGMSQEKAWDHYLALRMAMDLPVPDVALPLVRAA